MPYALYRCGDDTYVVTPEAFSPSIELLRRHGPSLRVRATERPEPPPQALAVLLRMHSAPYVIVTNDEVEALFEMG